MAAFLMIFASFLALFIVSASAENYIVVDSSEHYFDITSKPEKALVVVLFKADWGEESTVAKGILKDSAAKDPNFLALEVDIDRIPELKVAMEVDLVPYFVFLKGDKTVATLTGVHLNLSDKIKEFE